MMYRSSDSQEVTVEADSVEAAVRLAATELGVSSGQIRYRVVTEPRAGFLGWGARKARIRAWVHDSVKRHVEGALRAVRDLDGHHLLEVRGRDVLLTVYAPMGDGRPVPVSRILADVRDLGPESLDERAIEDAASLADGQAHIVGRLAREGERDGTFRIVVSEDGLACDVILFPPLRGGRDVKLETIRDALIAEGIRVGLDTSLLEAALADRTYHQPIRVATGRAPVPGEPGRIEWGFQTDRHKLRLKEDERGRVDFRELDLIECVKSGDILARRIPPGPGEPGEDVRGNRLEPPPAATVELPEGENIYAEGDVVRAAIDGHVSLVNTRLQVVPFYHVKGDVNYAVGNIDFSGTVCVDGLVEDAFSLKASGSAFVRKSIGKCRVEVGGNLVVVGGILGRQEADIRVTGDLIALFIEHSRILVRGDLMVHELILHSDVVVGGNLVMNGSRAALVGGSAFAGGDVTVRTIGGEGTSRTHIRAGIRLDLLEQMRSLKAMQAEDEAKLAKIEEALRGVEGRSGAASSIAAHDPRVVQLRSALVQIQSRLKTVRESLRALDVSIAETSVGARVHVIDTAMAGTRIEIGTASLVLPAPVQYATFSRMGGEIKINPYSGDL